MKVPKVWALRKIPLRAQTINRSRGGSMLHFASYGEIVTFGIKPTNADANSAKVAKLMSSLARST